MKTSLSDNRKIIALQTRGTEVRYQLLAISLTKHIPNKGLIIVSCPNSNTYCYET